MENHTLLEDVSLKAPLASHHNITSPSPFSPESVWTIRALYPMIGGYTLLSSLGLLVFFIKDARKARTNSQTPEKDDTTERDESKMSAKMKAVLVSLMAAMFFIYNGMEEAFGNFISIFAVKSSLHFTRPEGQCLLVLIFYPNKPLQGMAPTECPLSACLFACLLSCCKTDKILTTLALVGANYFFLF